MPQREYPMFQREHPMFQREHPMFQREQEDAESVIGMSLVRDHV